MLKNRQAALDAVETGFTEGTIVVAGDCMLDRYAWGSVSRISPEAPVPIVHVQHETASGGGAANVAINLAALGLHVELAGLTGEDAAGAELQEILERYGIGTEALLSVAGRPTITKTRVMGGHQQMLRLDYESSGPAPSQITDELLEMTLRLMDRKPAQVILSDYGKGTLSDKFCQAVIDRTRELKTPIIVDPKGTDFSKYTGATALAPNRSELAQVTGAAPDDLEGLLSAGRTLVNDLDLEFLVVTLGDQGIALLEAGSTHRIPALAQDVFDVSGAGDTVVATLAAALAAGLPRLDALYLANLAGGIVVGKVGTAPIRANELAAAVAGQETILQLEKIASLAKVAEQVQRWRARGEKIVFTNGCFDLLHPGHVAYLEAARQLGGRLVVGLNTDRSVRELKGPDRPIMSQEDRSRVLAALASVDMVSLFDEATPLKLINTLRPDVLAKGADYEEAEIVGAEEVRGWGGEVAIIPLVEGRSTSRIIQRLQAGGNPQFRMGKKGR